MIGPDDTLVLVGDHSWGRNLDACVQDLQFIAELPGRKILLRGNHDMFWDAKKTQMLNERYAGKLLFLQENFYPYEDYALVGTKGFCFEGPFYLNRRGQIVGWDEEKAEHAKKLVDRELERLRISFETARAAGYRRYILFLHKVLCFIFYEVRNSEIFWPRSKPSLTGKNRRAAHIRE